MLVEAEGQVLRREEIYERVWGYAMVHGDRSVDVFVRKLRQKLEKASPGWSYIHTHFGIGYRFAAEPVQVSSAELGRGGTRAGRGLVPARQRALRMRTTSISGGMPSRLGGVVTMGKRSSICSGSSPTLRRSANPSRTACRSNAGYRPVSPQ